MFPTVIKLHVCNDIFEPKCDGSMTLSTEFRACCLLRTLSPPISRNTQNICHNIPSSASCQKVTQKCEGLFI